VTIHHVDVQHARAAALDSLDLFSQTGKVSGKDRWSDFDVAIAHKNYGRGGDGRGAGGRAFTLPGRAFTLPRFTFARGVVFALIAAFAFGRLMLAGLFALLFEFLLLLAFVFALALAFSFVFLGRGRRGLSLLFVFVLRLSDGSSGVTVSEVSPSLVGRLMSMATV
jgi:hypothetical protein